jgi:hypothetical protein
MMLRFTKVVLAKQAPWVTKNCPYWANVSPEVLLGFSIAGLDSNPEFNGTLLIYAGYTVLIAETVDEFIRELTLNNIRVGVRHDEQKPQGATSEPEG